MLTRFAMTLFLSLFIASCLSAVGGNIESLPKIQAVSKKAKKESWELNSLAAKALRQNKFAEAEDYINKALKKNPNNLYAMVNMGKLFAKQSDNKKAREWYRKAIETDPRMIIKALNPDPRIRSTKSTKNLLASVLSSWNRNELEHQKALDLRADLENGRSVYMDTCSNKCHMPEAWGSQDGVYPQIAGQHRSVTIKQLADIRAKNRDNDSMFRFSLPNEIGGNQNIADVAAYIASLPMTPNNGLGPGKNLLRGKEIYAKDCGICHGANGEGSAAKYYPSIQGQHYKYLLRQLEWMRIGKRRNSHPLKEVLLRSYTDKDITQVLDYVSRLRPPKTDLASPNQKPQLPTSSGSSKEGADTDSLF